MYRTSLGESGQEVLQDNLIHKDFFIETSDFEPVFYSTSHYCYIGDDVNTIMADWSSLGSLFMINDNANGSWFLSSLNQGVDTLLKDGSVKRDFRSLQLDRS